MDMGPPCVRWGDRRLRCGIVTKVTEWPAAGIDDLVSLVVDEAETAAKPAAAVLTETATRLGVHPVFTFGSADGRGH